MTEDLPPAPIGEALDLSMDGKEAARDGKVIMLLVSRDDCPYCVLIKEEIIRPMIRGGDFKGQLLIRELYVDAGKQVIDFQGKFVEARTLAAAYSSKLTPTLLFLAPWKTVGSLLDTRPML